MGGLHLCMWSCKNEELPSTICMENSYHFAKRHSTETLNCGGKAY